MKWGIGKLFGERSHAPPGKGCDCASEDQGVIVDAGCAFDRVATSYPGPGLLVWVGELDEKLRAQRKSRFDLLCLVILIFLCKVYGSFLWGISGCYRHDNL